MAKVTIKSYAKQREAEIMSALKNGMGKAVLVVENQAKLNVTQSPPKHPQVDTGRLRASITSEVQAQSDEIVGLVGTNVYYGKYLELGTSNHPPYPWLFPAVESSKQKIKELLKAKSTNVEFQG